MSRKLTQNSKCFIFSFKCSVTSISLDIILLSDRNNCNWSTFRLQPSCLCIDTSQSPQVCSTSPPKTWSVSEVVKFIENSELAEHAEMFRKHVSCYWLHCFLISENCFNACKRRVSTVARYVRFVHTRGYWLEPPVREAWMEEFSKRELGPISSTLKPFD